MRQVACVGTYWALHLPCLHWILAASTTAIMYNSYQACYTIGYIFLTKSNKNIFWKTFHTSIWYIPSKQILILTLCYWCIFEKLTGFFGVCVCVCVCVCVDSDKIRSQHILLPMNFWACKYEQAIQMHFYFTARQFDEKFWYLDHFSI